MSVYPIRQITPIILPKERYTDRFDQPNAYVDMNPSMYIDSNGAVTLLVRRVNYRKYAGGTFTLGNYPSESKYVIAKGHIRDLSRLKVTPMNLDYGIPTHYAMWKGPEDIRFLQETRIIATIPECNASGNPTIFQASLANSVMGAAQQCFPNGTEKNWMPYEDDMGSTKVIYSLSPFCIKSVMADDREVLPIHLSELVGYHGSTNGIPYKGARLFLIHVNRERTYHRWLLFDPTKKTATVSAEFVFFEHSYIEFPVSLSAYGNRNSLYVSMGVNDEAAYVLEVVAPNF